MRPPTELHAETPASARPSLVSRALSAPGAAIATLTSAPARTLTAGRHLLDEVTGVIEQANLAARRAVTLVDVVELLIRDIATIAARAAVAVDAAEAVARDAGSSAAVIDHQLRRTQLLLEAYVPLLLELRPVVHQAGTALEPRHVEAIAQLLELTPDVVDLITPALQNLGDLTPELHQLADRFDAIGQIVEGIPGAKMFKRRAADDDDGPTE